MQKEDLTKFDLPDSPGIYKFLGPEGLSYIGMATSLKSRVRSYFAPDIIATRGAHIRKMVEDAVAVEWQTTDSVLEAMILEANLIKKHQPPANSRDRDNKSFNYLVITREEYPRVLVVRGRELFQKWERGLSRISRHPDQKSAFSSEKQAGARSMPKGTTSARRSFAAENADFGVGGRFETDPAKDIKHLFGPFPAGGSLKEAIKLVRTIFPFRDDTCTPESGKPCFNRQIGLCPGVCEGAMGKRAYAQVIRHIALLFNGKKEKLIEDLKKEMAFAAKRQRFEEASEKRRQIGALTHIRDVALIRRDAFESRGGEVNHFRIEAYDIAHTAGTETVGVMTVVEGGGMKKSDYRMFKIRRFKNDDTGALKEMLDRRLTHAEWSSPRLIVLDGGKGQLNAARSVLKKAGVAIPTAPVAKAERHRPREVIGDEGYRQTHERDILLANSEAHRFALAYHKKRRGRLQ